MFTFCSSLYIGIFSSGLAEMQFSKLSGQNCVAFNSLPLTIPQTSYFWCGLCLMLQRKLKLFNHTEFRSLLMPWHEMTLDCGLVLWQWYQFGAGVSLGSDYKCSRVSAVTFFLFMNPSDCGKENLFFRKSVS